MTVPATTEFVEQAEREARRRGQTAEKWVARPRDLGEARWDEQVHPRDRRGRFADKPGLPSLPKVASTIDAIQSWDDAVQFMRARGHGPDRLGDLHEGDRFGLLGREFTVRGESNLNSHVKARDNEGYDTDYPEATMVTKLQPGQKPPPFISFAPKRIDEGETPDANATRQILQAVLDMTQRYPVLTQGPVPLRRIDQIVNEPSASPLRRFAREGIWALTTDDTSSLYDGTAIYLNNFVKGKDTGSFNDNDVPAAHNGSLSPADATIYGRMVHELGHALVGTLLASSTAERDVLTQSGLAPPEVARFSRYAASSTGEAWAEVFATANVPGALEKVPEDLRPKIIKAMKLMDERTRKAANL